LSENDIYPFFSKFDTMYAPCIGVVILIIFLLIVKYYLRQRQDKYLAGIWTGDKEFLNNSQLKDFHLFIAPVRDGGKLKAFLTMSDSNGDTITTQIVWIDNSPFNNRIKFVFSDSDFAAIPENATMNIDKDKGTMMIYADSKLYGFLIKNNEMSIEANDKYESA
jgi:hypothetical protein